MEQRDLLSYVSESSIQNRVVSLTAIAWVHSSVWIEWLPAEQLVEGSNPSGPVNYMGSYAS
jgi:hypothetical protein